MSLPEQTQKNAFAVSASKFETVYASFNPNAKTCEGLVVNPETKQVRSVHVPVMSCNKGRNWITETTSSQLNIILGLPATNNLYRTEPATKTGQDLIFYNPSIPVYADPVLPVGPCVMDLEAQQVLYTTPFVILCLARAYDPSSDEYVQYYVKPSFDFEERFMFSKVRECKGCRKKWVNIWLCAGCKRMAYCGRECQLRDWFDGGHKAVCPRKDKKKQGE